VAQPQAGARTIEQRSEVVTVDAIGRHHRERHRIAHQVVEPRLDIGVKALAALEARRVSGIHCSNSPARTVPSREFGECFASGTVTPVTGKRFFSHSLPCG